MVFTASFKDTLFQRAVSCKVIPWRSYEPLVTDIWTQIAMGWDKAVLHHNSLIRVNNIFDKVLKKMQRL